MSVPPRQIRAVFDSETITVYQAYPTAIASPAVKEQKLNASPEFKLGRMTWIKPSWCWMMYRCGYSYKDQGQERVLALRMTHRHFQDLLANACLSSHVSEATQPNQTRVQWDPERGPRLEKLTYRSIQIGIPASRCKQWVDGEIESIEDVTHRARELKVAVETEPRTEIEDLVRLGLVPLETEYALPEALAQHLGMTE